MFQHNFREPFSACVRCRKHKVRCVSGEAGTVGCQRCQKAEIECVEYIPKRRTTRKVPFPLALHRPDNYSASDMPGAPQSALPPLPVFATPMPGVGIPGVGNPTSETAPLGAGLPASHVPPAIATPLAPPARPYPPTSTAHRAPPVLPISKPPEVPRARSPRINSMSTFWDSLNRTVSPFESLDPIIQTISERHMNDLVAHYKAMVAFFPYAPLPDNCSCFDLCKSRPIFILSIFTVASSKSALLQLTLSRELRKIIFSRILNGQGSLDVLQGLLVFIAWHHHYMDPQAASIQMLIQMCIGIASDLQLDEIASSPTQDYRARDAQRAYLGCYFLSSTYGMTLLATGKFPNLSYSETVRTYAAQLASTAEYRTDIMLPSLMETCQFVEDVEETFCKHSVPELDARWQGKRLTDRWDSMRQGRNSLARDFTTLDLLQLATRVYKDRTLSLREMPHGDIIQWSSGFPLQTRISCLRNVDSFLQRFTELETSQYECLSLIDWLNLLSLLTGLGRLILYSSPLPGWDPAEHDLLKMFEQHRDNLCEKIPKSQETQGHVEDVFKRFRRVTAAMKVSLGCTVRSPSGSTGSTFEITSSSRLPVSILQDLPDASCNLGSRDFIWRFLVGAV